MSNRMKDVQLQLELKRIESLVAGSLLTDMKERLAEMQLRHEILAGAAMAVVDRWDTPLWKETNSTAYYIYALRDALQQVEL